MTLATARIEWAGFREATAGCEPRRYPIKDATQLYEGQFVQLDSGGRLKPYAADGSGTDGGVCLGMVLPTPKDVDSATYLLGNTGLSPAPEAIVATGSFFLDNVSVTGASSQTNVGALVYLDANNTAGDHVLTLTGTNNGDPLGRVVKWRTSTYCDIRVLSTEERQGYTLP